MEHGEDENRNFRNKKLIITFSILIIDEIFIIILNVRFFLNGVGLKYIYQFSFEAKLLIFRLFE